MCIVARLVVEILWVTCEKLWNSCGQPGSFLCTSGQTAVGKLCEAC